MNKVLIASLALAASTMAVPAFAAGSINGNWKTKDGDAIVKIQKCGATTCGRISKFLVPPPDGVGQKDVNNPNKKLRSRKLLGMTILTGFKFDGKKWKGRVYDPKAGKYYRSELSLAASNKLKMKGCIGSFGPLCRTETWTRTR